MKKAVPLSLLVWAALSSNALATAPFRDVPEPFWALDAVRFAAVEHTFMQPTADGAFQGNAPFTRMQLGLAMRRLIAELEAETKTSWAVPGVGGYQFNDLPANDPAGREAVLDVANRYHLFEGLPGATSAALDANKVVTRYEMAKVVYRLVRLGETRGVIDPKVLTPHPRTFSDLPTSAWNYNEVKDVAERYQVMIGFPDGTFRGPEELTRYQFAASAQQTFPLVHALVQKTQEQNASPAPTPTPAPVSLRRFQEDTPWHVAVADRFVGASGVYGTGRWVGYAGPIFGLARVHAGTPLANNNRAYDGDLNVGYAWSLASDFALEPYLGGRVAYTGDAVLGAADYGAIASWNPGPFSLWVGGNGASPLGASTGSPLGLFLWDAAGGIGYAFTPRVALTLEAGYGTLPSGLLPATSGTTGGTAGSFGTESAASAELGLSFGF